MDILFFISGFVAEVVGTVAGFGSSTIFLPLALLFFDFRTSLVLVAFMHIFGNLGRISFFRHGLDRKLLWSFGLPSVISTFIGALFASYLPQTVLKGILGVFLVGYALVSLIENFRLNADRKNIALGGATSGFLAGLIGTGGALRGAFLTAFQLKKEKYIATAAAIAIAVDLTRIPVYVSQGFLEQPYYWYIPVLFIVALTGSYIGKQIVDIIPQKIFRNVVLLGLVLVGVKFVFDWLS
ncbi:sulfite exporter TauE/SafE family protein [Candidatus Gottesmanbacteria bacterium]|nr:sulfite exporter TauE/SafE family protein [Candidatus Gottesmanbacteria bacterium]